MIDALNAEGPDIDIILSEVDLPMAKGLKMLKYIMRDKELQRIPVISKFAKFTFLFSLNVCFLLLGVDFKLYHVICFLSDVGAG